MEEVVVGESYVAVDGLIKVVDVGETQPEVAQRPVYALWMIRCSSRRSQRI